MSARQAQNPERIKSSPLLAEASLVQERWQLELSNRGHNLLRESGLNALLAELELEEQDLQFVPSLPGSLVLDPNEDWPEIWSVRQSDGALDLLMRVEPGLRWFQGHFPGEPILAGVVQLHWAGELGRRHFHIESEFRSVQALKFQNVIRPGTQLCLTLDHDPDRQRIAFSFSSCGQPCSQGRIHFDA